MAEKAHDAGPQLAHEQKELAADRQNTNDLAADAHDTGRDGRCKRVWLRMRMKLATLGWKERLGS